jgi:hypothetical protein
MPIIRVLTNIQGMTLSTRNDVQVCNLVTSLALNSLATIQMHTNSVNHVNRLELTQLRPMVNHFVVDVGMRAMSLQNVRLSTHRTGSG